MDDLFNSNVVDQSKSDAKRSEIVPRFISTLHKVPKQIIDTSQMVGVNEQMQKRKLNSGVLVASQIAHDKWLTRFDGTMDSIWLYIIILTITLTGINFLTLTITVLGFWYWWYHVLWYSKAKEWDGNITSSEYTIDTVKVFWKTFILCSISLYAFTAYIITSKYSYIFQWIVAHCINIGEGIYGFFERIFSNKSFELSVNTFSMTKNEQKLSENDIKDLIFSDENEKSIESIESLSYDTDFLSSIFLNKQEVYAVLNKFSLIDNFYTVNGTVTYKLSTLMIFVLIFIIVTVVAKKKYDQKYEKRKNMFIKDTEENLKSKFRIKLDDLNNM